MGNFEVLAMRAYGRASGTGVTAAAVAKLGGEVGLIPSLERDRRSRELVLRCGGKPLIQRRDRACSGGCDGSPMLRHLLLQRGQPLIVPALVREELVAGAHGRFVAGAMVRVCGLQREHQPIEKAP